MSTLVEHDTSTRTRQERRVRALIVDDSPQARDAIRLLLKSQPDVEVVGFAEDGEQALAQAEALCPDLVLMDIQMPKLDGLRATRMVRSSFPRTRVIIVTVNQGVEIKQTCLTHGADGLVTKDRLYQDLFAEIRRIFPPCPP